MCILALFYRAEMHFFNYTPDDQLQRRISPRQTSRMRPGLCWRVRGTVEPGHASRLSLGLRESRDPCREPNAGSPAFLRCTSLRFAAVSENNAPARETS